MMLNGITQRHVLHEFGHALGWGHEHQSPDAEIHWDKPQVYNYYLVMDGWSRAKVDSNIFDLYNATSAIYTNFDAESVMEYDVSSDLTTDHVGIVARDHLSATDIAYAREWYPAMRDASGELVTGETCESVLFRVEYASKEAGKGIRFDLAAHEGMPWTALHIPLKDGSSFELQTVGGLATTSFAATELDFSRPIELGKSTPTGEQRWLPAAWEAMPALPSGTRLTLDWRNDRCH